ncbi:MAG: tripartite tricarboxylate transporter substrate binding protein [Betaproteobacteria bacterium]|nr:tripartite tricarboxylate transporter substrate binding protein [Betaproteobacteria bacterium]
MKRSCCIQAVALLVSLALGAGGVLAQRFPNKPVHIVVPVAPGGAIDLTARLVGQRLAEAWKQPVVIDNRPGAGETIGANLVAKAAPDGHTLLLSSSLATSAAIHKTLPYDAARDFAAVTQLITSPQMLVVGPKLTLASVGELIALVKSKPGQLKYGHAGVGSALHLEMEQFKLSASLADLPGIPYKGAAPANSALLAGEVDVAVMPLSMVLAHVKAARLRAIGVLGAKRLAVLPDLATLSESGVPGVEMDAWNGFFAPAKTPPEIISLIQRETLKVLNVPEVRDKLLSLGYVIVGSTPEEFDARYKSDLATFARVVKEARVPLQD